MSSVVKIGTGACFKTGFAEEKLDGTANECMTTCPVSAYFTLTGSNLQLKKRDETDTKNCVGKNFGFQGNNRECL